MDIKQRLEEGQSKSLVTAIVNYVGNDKKRFKVLMDLFLKSDYRMTQRAAWPLSNIGLEHPELFYPYLGKLVGKLQEPDQHPAVARNILRILPEMNIPEKHHGVLIDIYFKLIMDQTQPVAIRAFAITAAAQLCQLYPELKDELLIILGELGQFPQTAAVKVRIKSALKNLKAAYPSH